MAMQERALLATCFQRLKLSVEGKARFKSWSANSLRAGSLTSLILLINTMPIAPKD